MKVRIILYGPVPGMGASGKRVQLYRDGLQAAGLDCEVVSIPRRQKRLSANLYRYLLEPFVATKTASQHVKKGDVLLVYGFGWVTNLALIGFCKLRKVTIIKELNEKPASIPQFNIFDCRPLKFIRRLGSERFCLPFFDGVITISKPLEDFVYSIAPSGPSVFRVPIIVDCAKYDAAAGNTCSGGTPYIFHSGFLSDHKDGVFGILKAFAKVVKQYPGRIDFYLTTDRAAACLRKEMNHIIKEHHLEEYVHVTGPLSDADLIAYQRDCAMLIIFKPDNEQNRFNFSTKLGEYLALGKTVICTPVGEMQRYLVNGENAFVVESGDIEGLTERMLYILDDRNAEDVMRIGRNGKHLAEKEFDYIIQGQRLAKFILSLVQNDTETLS